MNHWVELMVPVGFACHLIYSSEGYVKTQMTAHAIKERQRLSKKRFMHPVTRRVSVRTEMQTQFPAGAIFPIPSACVHRKICLFLHMLLLIRRVNWERIRCIKHSGHLLLWVWWGLESSQSLSTHVTSPGYFGQSIRYLWQQPNLEAFSITNAQNITIAKTRELYHFQKNVKAQIF